MQIVFALVLLGSNCSALGDYAGAADYLKRALVLDRDALLISPLLRGLVGRASLYGRQGQYDVALELLAITLNHPQRKAKVFLDELRSNIAEDDIATVMDKAKRGQLSNRYLEPDFIIDAALVDRLLALIDEAV